MGKGKKPDPKAQATRKSEAAEVAKRVEEVLRIRLDGAQFHDVVQYAAEQGWDVQERQLRNYIRRADDLLVERQDRNRRRVIARHVAQREALYARAVNTADYRTALAVLADLAKLRGLYPEREVKELLKLAASQGVWITELEGRLNAPGHHPTTTPPAGPEAGPAGGRDAGGAGGAAGELPGRPQPPDG